MKNSVNIGKFNYFNYFRNSFKAVGCIAVAFDVVRTNNPKLFDLHENIIKTWVFINFILD